MNVSYSHHTSGKVLHGSGGIKDSLRVYLGQLIHSSGNPAKIGGLGPLRESLNG